MPKSPQNPNLSLKVKTVDAALLDSLNDSAKASERHRSHFSLHHSLDDPFQRMVVGIEPRSYIRPHRHQITPKPESLFCLRGRIGVVIFDDSGESVQAIELGSTGPTWGCDLEPGIWHSIVCLESGSAFVESKPGPYVPFAPDDFAPWAPEPGPNAETYLTQLQQLFAAA